ncbi:MAG: DUF4392 domain-containing protein [Planctomycetia bacterium]|nr:DUF4392 domain-containing protein [Planctomycetia bacterium]
MTTDEKLSAILSAVQTDPGNRGLARDPHDNLFTATRGDFEAACRSIADDPVSGVAILTGFYIPTATPPAAETDGPLGAIHLAVLLTALGYQAVVLIDSWGKQAIETGLRRTGLAWDRITNPFELRASGHRTVPVWTVPPHSHPWYAFQALDWHHAIEGYALRHAVAIERVGPSRQDGRPYSMRGRDLSEFTAPMHHLIEECHRMRPQVGTIGIGDGGNEIGMGKVSWNTVNRNIPSGAQIACRVPTDQLIVAGVSNWGAYALAAGVYVLRGVKPSRDLFDPDREREILEVMVREGPLVDGVTGKQTATVDGLSWDEYVKPLVRIREILESS